MYISDIAAHYLPNGYSDLTGISYNDEDNAKILVGDEGSLSDIPLSSNDPATTNPNTSRPTYCCGFVTTSTSRETYMQQIIAFPAAMDGCLIEIQQEFCHLTARINVLYEKLDQSSSNDLQPSA